MNEYINKIWDYKEWEKKKKKNWRENNKECRFVEDKLYI